MNIDWSINQLAEFIRLAKQNGFIRGTMAPNTIGTREQILRSWSVCKVIVDRIEPGWERVGSITIGYEWELCRDAAIRCEEKLKRQIEIEENLGLGSIIAKSTDLHPEIYENCKKLWEDGHFREAVQKAGTSLDNYLQNKIRRFDISGTKLINEAFRNDDQLGKNVIKVPEQINEETTKNYREGLKYLGLACMQYIRNISTHDAGELSENDALRQMMTMSLYLSGLDECEIAIS